MFNRKHDIHNTAVPEVIMKICTPKCGSHC